MYFSCISVRNSRILNIFRCDEVRTYRHGVLGVIASSHDSPVKHDVAVWYWPIVSAKEEKKPGYLHVCRAVI
jgi:hypothetical protein